MDPFRNFSTYKIDPLTEIRNAGIVTNGSVFYVSSTADSAHTTRTNNLGNMAVQTTLQGAIDASVSDRNDYILVIPTDGGTVRALGTAVDVNEDRLHILGMGYKPAPMAYNGLTFEGYVATAQDTELVNVTGAGVELGGLKFLGTSGTADGGTITALMRVGTASSGTPHDFWMHDVHVENTQAAAANGTAVIVNYVGAVGGGITGNSFDRCWLGNWNWAPAQVINLGGGTAGPTRFEARDCTLVTDAQVVGDDFVVMGTGQIEYALFKNCDFINVEAGTALTSAFTGAILVDNPLILRNNSYLNVTQAGTDTEAYKSPAFSGTNPGIADTGIYIGTAAISPV